MIMRWLGIASFRCACSSIAIFQNFHEGQTKSRNLVLACILLDSSTIVNRGQQGFFSAREHRVRVTSSHQPAWPMPVLSPSSGLVQLMRFDAIRQYTPSGNGSNR